MDANRCSIHKSQSQKACDNKRTLNQKRHWFELTQEVVATDEYTKAISESPKFNNGYIIAFRDPYEWEPKRSSTALVSMSCGCRIWIDTSWLKKV